MYEYQAGAEVDNPDYYDVAIKSGTLQIKSGQMQIKN
jgi:hypothetical protein